MSAQPIRCERCGEELVRSYSTTAYSGTAQTFQLGPDGTGALFPLGGMVACSWNCLAILAAQRAGQTADAAVRIVAERERQVTAEGFSPEADATMPEGSLALAGLFYVLGHAVGDLPKGPPPDLRITHENGYDHSTTTETRWPWDAEWWKPKSRERDLVRAGALIAAELDRDPDRRRSPDPRDEPF